MLNKLLLLFRINLYLAVALVVFMASIMLSVKQGFKRRRAKKTGITSHSSATTSKTELTSCDEEVEISNEFIAIAVFDQESKSADSADVEKRNMRKPTHV